MFTKYVLDPLVTAYAAALAIGAFLFLILGRDFWKLLNAIGEHLAKVQPPADGSIDSFGERLFIVAGMAAGFAALAYAYTAVSYGARAMWRKVMRGVPAA